MMMKNGLEFFLESTEPLQIPANLPGQFSLSGWDFFLHWAVVTLKGLGEFQNKKILDILEMYDLFQKC